MNIKGLISNILPDTKVRSVENIGKTIKSDETHDRDANGQETYSQNQEQQREPMSDEQLERAMEHLRNLPAMKEHKWTVELAEDSGNRFVIVKDNLGTVIRRIPELELWSLPSDNSPRGQLLKRSA
ncbi:flagellar protein FlaG [Bdellovibrio bacteriovorus]|uniref:flagellar protein FlaG n=1 Tax=Bdellovibrio TaxID=958 RepID=UPI0035A9212A